MSELRYDPIRRSWVIIAAERGKRPAGLVDHAQSHEHGPAESCPFCPGNEGMTPPEITAIREPGTAPDSPGWLVRVIPNKFPALETNVPLERSSSGLYDVISGFGTHEILVETPKPDAQMDDFSLKHLRDIFVTLRNRLVDLKKDKRFQYVMVFKNYGIEAGSSLRHAHSQIIAVPVIPNLISAELSSFREYFRAGGSCLMCDIVRQEVEDAERIVIDSDKFIAFTPYPSSFPFEVRITPKGHSHDFALTSDFGLEQFARIVRGTLRKLKGALNDPPYNFILHTSPSAFERAERPGFWKSLSDDYHWYLELIPRTTKIAGFEWGTGFYVNTMLPEDAAKLLRES